MTPAGMESVLAVLRFGNDHSHDAMAMVQSAMGAADGPATQLQEFAHRAFAIAVRKRSVASDIHLAQADDRVFYVQGWVNMPGQPPASRALHRLDVDKLLPDSISTSDADLAALTGAFQAIVFDTLSHELTCVVDRTASRPLYYYVGDTFLVVSSDVGVMLRVPGVDCCIDIAALAQFVRVQTIMENRTLYRDIKRLPPGSVLRAKREVSPPYVTCRPYWRMLPLDPFTDREEAIRGVADAYWRAGERITIGNPRGGILVSGGMDSRMVLAVIQPHLQSLSAFTFGPAHTEESDAARLLAERAGIPWHFVVQAPLDYWAHLDELLPMLQGRYSLAHANTYKTARVAAVQGIDTIYHGGGADSTFAGSYLPKETVALLGREVYTYRLAPLSPRKAEVADAVLRQRDIQGGDFSKSYLSSWLGEVWARSARDAYLRAVERASEGWTDPYDWFEKALFSSGFSEFYPYPVTVGIRLVARERSPLYDSGVIDAYLRLSPSQRFLGKVYRQSLLRIRPDLARIVYPNVGTSAFAPPAIQAASLQARWLLIGIRETTRKLLESVGLTGWLKPRYYGSYPSFAELLEALVRGGQTYTTPTVTALTDGFLAQSGITDAARLTKRLAAGGFADENEALSIIALASLAAWFERNPARKW